MTPTIVAATRNFQWKNFCIHQGNRMLLDARHLNHEVFMPRHGMVHIPFSEWIEKGWLEELMPPVLKHGQSHIKMTVADLDGPEHHLERMFAFIKRGWEDEQPLHDMVGAEVGVFEGANAERILEELPIKRLYLIDSYGTTLSYQYNNPDLRAAQEKAHVGYATVAYGGVWGGHDYKNTVEGECEVKSCVDEFFIDRELSNLWYSSTKLNWWHVKGRE